MKTVLLLGLLCASWTFQLSAQCATCYSIEEATKNPLSVRYLNLNAQGLTSLGNELEQFPNLEELIVSNNSITDISVDFMKLPKLVKVDFSYNPGFNFAFLPESFFNTKIEIIKATNCNLIFLPIDMGKLSKLKVLNVSNNKLPGLPFTLSNCLKLEEIDLANNKLQKNKGIFSDFWKLKKINVSGNPELRVQDLIYSLEQKDSLKELVLSLNTSRKIFGKNIANLNVESLHFVNTNIASFNPAIQQNRALKKIIFEDCKILDPEKVYGQLDKIPNLEGMSYLHTDVNNQVKKLNQLKRLNIQESFIDPSTNLNSFKKLDLLGIYNSPIESEQLPQLKDSVQLETKVFEISNEMQSNQLPSLSSREPMIKTIQGNVAQEVKFENSFFKIPENAFLTQDKQIYTGPVTLEVKEYNDAIINALEGMPMMIRESGRTELFTSSGMFEFRALTEDGKTLAPNPDALIEVELKDLQPEEQTNLYAYDTVSNNWTQIGTPIQDSYNQVLNAYIDSLTSIPDMMLIQRNIISVPIQLNFKKRRNRPSELSFSSIERPLKYGKFFVKKDVNIYLDDRHTVYFTKQKWIIDSILDQAAYDLFKKIKKEQEALYSRSTEFNRSNYGSIPRLFKNVELIPDFENDCYRLSMIYKGDSVRLPIYLNSKKVSVKREQIQNGKFYQHYSILKRKNDKKVKNINDFLRKNEEKLAREIRLKLIYQKEIAMIRSNIYPANLSFRITTFGFINCDRPTPPQILNTLEFDDQGIDQNGDTISIPKNLRYAQTNQNTYAEIHHKFIPEFAKGTAILFFAISAVEIAVIRSWKTIKGVCHPIIERISIEGLDSNQIKALMLRE